MKLAFALVAATIVGTAHVRAGTITDLFDTGVGSNGLLLPDGSIDPHYNVSYSTIDGTGGSSTVTVGSPSIGWNGDGTSAWVMPSVAYPGGGMPKGYYEYQTWFSLPGNANSVTISANVSTDLIGLNIVLNGTSIGVTEPWINPVDFTSTNVFTGTDANMLTFVTINTPIYTGDFGTTGLGVSDIAGSYTVIPEPSALAIPIFALVGFRGRPLRRRNSESRLTRPA